jgi:SAM-dependent methyltransferase
VKLQDPRALQRQYGDSSNLGSRISLHARFSTAEMPWPNWVFERLRLEPNDRVLEVGGGPGMLWRANIEAMPAGCRVTVTDMSPGMVAEASAAIDDERFDFRVADAQALPFPDASFDALVANHMLYHVPDLDAALGEFARVLLSGGRLVAATNGRGHMPELASLLDAVGLEARRWAHVEAFGLESGVAPVERRFDDVRVERHTNVLAVTDAHAVLDYVDSLPASRPSKRRSAADEILRLVQREIDVEGAFRISTDAGIITGRAH